MTLYDSSLLIDYLDGVDAAVEYVERRADERAVTLPLALFEVYQGEVFRSDPADFDAVADALGWVTVVEATAGLARTSAELQAALHGTGRALSARDAFVAGGAAHLDERLAVADADFEAVSDRLDVDIVR